MTSNIQLKNNIYAHIKNLKSSPTIIKNLKQAERQQLYRLFRGDSLKRIELVSLNKRLSELDKKDPQLTRTTNIFKKIGRGWNNYKCDRIKSKKLIAFLEKQNFEFEKSESEKNSSSESSSLKSLRKQNTPQDDKTASLNSADDPVSHQEEYLSSTSHESKKSNSKTGSDSDQEESSSKGNSVDDRVSHQEGHLSSTSHESKKSNSKTRSDSHQEESSSKGNSADDTVSHQEEYLSSTSHENKKSNSKIDPDPHQEDSSSKGNSANDTVSHQEENLASSFQDEEKESLSPQKMVQNSEESQDASLPSKKEEPPLNATQKRIMQLQFALKMQQGHLSPEIIEEYNKMFQDMASGEAPPPVNSKVTEIPIENGQQKLKRLRKDMEQQQAASVFSEGKAPSSVDVDRVEVLCFFHQFFFQDYNFRSNFEKHLTVLPIHNETDFWSSIYDKSDFYKKTLCPTMKFLAVLVSAHKGNPETLFKKWQTGLDKVASLWEKAGKPIGSSQVRKPDFGNLWEFARGINLVFKFLAVSKVNMEQFFRKLQLIKVDPKVPKNGILSSLDCMDQWDIIQAYISNPKKNNDLARLFQPGTAFQKWPVVCQFLLAIFLINAQEVLRQLEIDSYFRKGIMDLLNYHLRSKTPVLVKAAHKLARNDSWLGVQAFNFGLKKAFDYLKNKEIEPELVQVQRKKTRFKQEVVDFVSTPARIKYDNELRLFIKSFRGDLLDGIFAKHSTETEELKKNPNKEFNLQDILIRDSRTMKLVKTSNRLLKDYLEEIEKDSESPLKEEKKAKFILAQNEMVLAFCHSMQAYSSLLTSQPHYLKFLKVMDSSAIPGSAATQGVPDWLTDTMLGSFNKLF